MVIKNILYKKSFLLITLAIIFTGSNILAISNPGHSADEILITINDITMTLQEAIDNEFLKDWATQPTQDIYTKIMLKGHDANKITISIDGEKSLQEVVNDSQISFCQDVNSWGLMRRLISNIGHFSDKVEVQFKGQPTTLQAMIDNSEFCSYSWEELGDWGTCSRTCGIGTQTETVRCKRSDGKINGVTDIQCTNDGQGTKPSDNQLCNTQPCLTCDDGIQNQGEEDIDCGGPCSECVYPLYQNQHTEDNCRDAIGIVITNSNKKVCKFPLSSCPYGWDASGHTTTINKLCKGVTNCATGSHLFLERSRESCRYKSACMMTKQSKCPYLTCYAIISEVGCY
jgi:hypothetical protein